MCAVGAIGLLYHTWVFGADCDPNTDQTANINVVCFGIEGMKQVDCDVFL